MYINGRVNIKDCCLLHGLNIVRRRNYISVFNSTEINDLLSVICLIVILNDPLIRFGDLYEFVSRP